MTNKSQPDLTTAFVYSESMIVEPRHTVPQVAPWPGFADMPEVFATAMMIGFVEQTCIQGLRPFLSEGQGTVGVGVNLSHVAPTPVGGKVAAKVSLKTQDRKRLVFTVEVTDDNGIIGEGEHERVIVELARFNENVLKRQQQV